MKNLYKFIFIFCLIYCGVDAAPQVTIGTYTTEINSDFGPRKIGNKCQFHRAIDLKGSAGTAFPLIKGGKVVELKYATDGSNILICTIEVSSTEKHRYLHMFSNATLPIDSGDFTLCETHEKKNYAIVCWSNKSQNRAKYILSTEAGQTVKINNNFVIEEIGNEVAESVNVLNPTDHPYIGPIGTSGGYSAHMHIDMGLNVNKNPLYYIPHNKEENFEIGLWDRNNNERENGWIVKKDDANSYYLKITITSVETLNLDEILIYIDSVDNNNLLWKFSYGGKPKADGTANFPINTDVEKGACSNGITDGVYSVDKDNNGESEVGYERFIFSKWEESLEVKDSLRVSKLKTGEHELIIKAKNVMGENKGEKRIKFYILPSDYALYSSRCRPMPTATPYLDRVVVKDLKQEPTEEPTGEVTPGGSPVSSPTPTPEIKVVPIDKYLKGVLLACVGNADFSDEKYLEGFKAMGIAAYTLLLYEIQKNTGYDIAVNGYTGSQNYYIPYTDFDSAAGPSKNIISVAIDGGNYAGKKREGILLKIGEGDAVKYYIKAFWFDTIKQNRGDFESDVMIDGKSVKWPKIKTILFSYAGGKSARNVIIQSALNVLGKAETYAREFSIENYQFSIKEKQMKIKKT